MPTDHVQQYSRALLFRGLLHMLDKEFERENDGEEMMRMWKLNMLDFWRNHHNKYLILGHRLLSSKL